MNDDVVVLTGVQRSGTTALGACLAQAYHDRGDCFTVNGKLLYLLRRWLTDADLAARHLRADEIWHAVGRRTPLGPATPSWLARTEEALRYAARLVADGEWEASADELAAEVLAQAYDGHARRWGEKYNETMLDLQHLRATVPRARVLLVFRHPVAVARSMERWSGDRPWRPSTVAACWDKWRSWNETALTALAGSGLEVLAVEHARLCAEPAVRERVAEFAGVSGDDLAGLRPPAHDATQEQVPPEVESTWDSLMSEMEKSR